MKKAVPFAILRTRLFLSSALTVTAVVFTLLIYIRQWTRCCHLLIILERNIRYGAWISLFATATHSGAVETGRFCAEVIAAGLWNVTLNHLSSSDESITPALLQTMQIFAWTIPDSFVVSFCCMVACHRFGLMVYHNVAVSFTFRWTWWWHGNKNQYDL
jgi:hypothetical protein